MREMKIVVGLGNPGKEYQNTRHNLGWQVVERLAREVTDGRWLVVKNLKSSIINRQPLFVLAKPMVFMNESGRAVRRLLKHFKVAPANLWIVHDDIDLPLGKVKIQFGRGAAGHHGVESIIKEIGTKGFWRVRMGIGRPGERFQIPSSKSQVPNSKLQAPSSKSQIPAFAKTADRQMPKKQVEKFVLEEFSREEKPIVKEMIEKEVERLKGKLRNGEIEETDDR